MLLRRRMSRSGEHTSGGGLLSNKSVVISNSCAMSYGSWESGPDVGVLELFFLFIARILNKNMRVIR